MALIILAQTACFCFLMFFTGHVLNAQAGDAAAQDFLNSTGCAYAIVVCAVMQVTILVALFFRAFHSK